MVPEVVPGCRGGLCLVPRLPWAQPSQAALVGAQPQSSCPTPPAPAPDFQAAGTCCAGEVARELERIGAQEV